MIHIIIILLIIIGLFILIIKGSKKWFRISLGTGIIYLFGNLFFLLLISYCLIRPIVVIDPDPMILDGKIEGVKKNIGGTYTLHFKTDERKKFCIEDEDIAEFAEKHSGKHVIIGKEPREGIYPIGNCQEGPIVHIELFEELKIDE